ncbi:hypothetical protein KSC_069400 [Ktedonobacter sp. SOSP1-52]|uniref:hypothetical protein n=1 Tax=Ktedonobacter sp. SOSP1-52 TaxID=2778366 RepID=UPI001A2D65B0|nr:hypothetical protein [Ktedonobacter sp. SOSP1-52]GHO68048.1 hypothetical protein KSC_069400 [Ktedonobacter sp. SOSP1-52]
MRGRNRSQHPVHCSFSCLGHGLGMWVGFEHRQGCLSTGISKYLGKLGKQHYHQRLDLILVAGGLFAQLGMQAHEFPVGGDLLARDIAHARFTNFRRARAMVIASKRSVFACNPRC